MARLPTVGGDSGTWGTGLNDYLTKTVGADHFALNGAVAEGATSFTLSTAPPMAAHQGWFLIDPWTTSAELWRPTSISGSTVTCATASTETLTASNISFTAATKKIAGSAEAISKFFPGEKIVVSGSAANNGTYTVAAYPTDGTYDGTYITTVEALVNESAGASVTITRKRRAHSDGAIVLFTHGPVSVTLYGAKASGDVAHGAATRAAIQRCLDDSYYAGQNDVYMPGFMAGRYLIDGPIYLEKLTHLHGPHHKSAVIAPSQQFCWNDDVAMLITRRNGLVCRTANGPNDRYYISGIGLDGGVNAYAKSTGYDQSTGVGTGYVQSATNTFSIHAYRNVGGITYRALAGGTGGNALRIAHVNDGPSQPLTVTATGNDITVHLATNGSSVVTSTQGDVITAVNTDADSNTLVEASLVQGHELGVTGYGNGELAITSAMTAFTAGTAPFVAGDVGRSINIATGGVSQGAGAGSRTITGFTNAYTVTVSGSAWAKSYAGMRWAVSGTNGALGSFNQTSRWDDVRIEAMPGYCFFATGSQEFSVRNMMTLFSGTHMRLQGVQFAHFYDCNMEHGTDAYVSFESIGVNDINRSNHFIGGHIEDTAMCEYFRFDTPSQKVSNFWVMDYQATSAPFTTAFYFNTSLTAGYGVLGWEWSGPNAGPVFVKDVDRNITLLMTDFDMDTFVVPLWVAAKDGFVGSTTGIQTIAWTTGSVTPNAGRNSPIILNVNASGAFTINAPSNPLHIGQQLQFDIRNNSGGAMGTITWDAVFKLAGSFTNPANTKRRTIAFQWDGASWTELNRAAADI